MYKLNNLKFSSINISQFSFKIPITVRILNTFLFLLSNKIFVISAGIHKIQLLEHLLYKVFDLLNVCQNC